MRIAEYKTLADQAGVVIERGSVQEAMALRIDEHPGALGAIEHEIAVARGGFPGEGVAQPGTPARLDADAQTALRKTVLGGHLPDQVCGVFRDFQHVWAQNRRSSLCPLQNYDQNSPILVFSRYGDQLIDL